MRNLLSFLLCLLIAGQAFAGGKITGTITDGKSGETLIGVSVTLKQPEKETDVAGTITDIDGSFAFEAPAGTYELEIRYVGYQPKEITEVVVKDGETTTVPVSMTEPKSTDLDEVVIRGTLKKESVNALYTMQKNAVAVSDGISADVIRRSPDRSTGEALKRVSGTTIQDGKFVIVRGLSDRYNTALVDDAILPSTEPNRKAFSFDIIPATMIDNIVITKSGTPDLPGDFAGGVINILTKEVPSENYNNISIGTSYNTASTGKSFKSGYRTGTDFLGFDNGERQLHPNFPTTAGLSKLNPNKPQQSVPYLKALNNDFSVNEHTALPAINLQGSLGRIINLKGNSRFGITAAVTYNHSENIKKDLLRQYDNYDYKDNIYNYSSNLGALLNLGYYTGKSKITLKTFYNRIFDDNFLYREGENYSSTKNVKYYAYDLIQKSLFKTTLSGEHQVGAGQSKLNWLVSYNYITNNQPDQRKVSYFEGSTPGQYIADLGTLGKANSRLFSDLNETVLNGSVNYSIPFKFLEKSNLKIGAFGQYRTRDFENRYLGAVINTSKADYETVLQRPIETLFGTDVINNNYYSILDQTGDGDQYTATATNMGGYVMMDNKVTSNFRIVWGARLESYHIDLSTKMKQEVNRTWTDILPSANLTYSLNDKSNLRGSYFRSVARPELREMANLGYYDYELSANITGNPQLKRTMIDNMDLRYEWFMNAGEVFSTSFFYKNFSNTLESQVYGAGSGYDIKPNNFRKGTNVGVELELRKRLDFIAKNSFFKNLTYYVNLAYIKSDVKVDSLYIRGKMVSERPLTGQAPFVINTSLGYTSDNGKLNLNVLYNRVGQRLTFIGQDRFGIVYEAPRNLLDFQISYAVTKRSEFRLNVKDILNNPVRLYFDQDDDKKFTGSAFKEGKIIEGQDWILQEYKPGSTISLSYSYKF